MARYNRINLDGVSDTKSGIVTAQTLAGTFLKFNAGTGKFVAATAATLLEKYYVANINQTSVVITDPILAGGYVNAEILSNNRELAGMVAISQTVLVDSPLTLTTGGMLKVATGVEVVVGWSTEALTTDGTTPQLVKFLAA